MSEFMATVFWLGGIALAAWLLIIRHDSSRSKPVRSHRMILFAGLVLLWSIGLFILDSFLMAMAFDD